MRDDSILLRAGAALACLAAGLCGCLVPPSMYERASWGPPPDYWQEQGRYRQSNAGEVAPESRPGPEAPGAPAPRNLDLERTDPMAEGAEQIAAPRELPPLHAWDGGVVDGAPQGRVTPQSGTPRGLETPPAGRMHIIELYQQVLDERDALAQEVEGLRASLEETTLALEAKTEAADDLAARVAALEEMQRALTGDNQALAARLVQAQIRRLEAEKLLLETRIEAERAKAEEAARAAAAQAKSGKTKPPAKPGEGERE
jgi:hypothetical protein